MSSAKDPESKYTKINWLDKESPSYYEYWNNVEEEKKKEWWIIDDDYSTLEAYLSNSGLIDELSDALNYVKRNHKIEGTIIDIAAGNCWAVPYLIKMGYKHATCLDFSNHRIFQMGPDLCSYYNIHPESVTFIWGSFHHFLLPDKSVDAVLMSQALHHADDVISLLSECKRILKDDGIFIIIGEPYVSIQKEFFLRIKGIISVITNYITTNNTSQPKKIHKSLWIDPVLGDHIYSRSFLSSLVTIQPHNFSHYTHHAISIHNTP